MSDTALKNFIDYLFKKYEKCITFVDLTKEINNLPYVVTVADCLNVFCILSDNGVTVQNS